jgi:hypothetical protein
MNRYAPAVERLLPRVDPQSPGIGIIVVAPGQHALVAEALQPHFPGAASAPLNAALLQSGAPYLLITGLPKDRKDAEAALTGLNQRRGWISSSGKLVILLLTRHEVAEFQRSAPDSYSARLFLESIPFVPDTTVDEAEARRALAQWYRERFGRIDLRGFIRSESEDVSWHIEDIYQDVQATFTYYKEKEGQTPADNSKAHDWVVWMDPHSPAELEVLVKDKKAPLINWLSSYPKRLPDKISVILGPPGSGKTFFLRWLAASAATMHQQCGVKRPLPLLTSLSAYMQAPGPTNLLDYFVETLLDAQQPAAHLVKRAATEGRVLFLLDGLDEVGDASASQRVREAVRALSHNTSGNMIVVTSRISGYESTSLPGAHFTLSPFDDEAIQAFLIRWCELYARDRLGDAPSAQHKGQEEGRKLARDVLAHREIHELARSPLLLTVLAVVHRAGVRLPDHRVELYEHTTRILVERWNRVRSLSELMDAPPLKTADAVRLLGPVALETIRLGTRGAISEETLRQLLDESLTSGQLRGLTSAEEAITLFRDSLGLLVEQGPGIYSFLHLTLAEYFAARELVRSRALEQLAANAKRAFLPEWREVFLLAAGELGVNRADDARLKTLVRTLLKSASRRSSDPVPSVPSLLAGLLADDPGLTTPLALELIHELIPKWWFTCEYKNGEALEGVITEARVLVEQRLMNGRFSQSLHDRLLLHFGTGAPSSMLKRMNREKPWLLSVFINLLTSANVDYGPVFLQELLSLESDSTLFFLCPTALEVLDEHTVIRFAVSRWLDQQLRSEHPGYGFSVFITAENQVVTIQIPWAATSHIRDWTGKRLVLEAHVPNDSSLQKLKNTELSFTTFIAKLPSITAPSG